MPAHAGIQPSRVIPANAGIQSVTQPWIPAFAGMTVAVDWRYGIAFLTCASRSSSRTGFITNVAPARAASSRKVGSS